MERSPVQKRKRKKGVTKLLVNCSRMAQSDGVVRVNQFFVRFLPLRVAYAERLGSSAQWMMVMVVVGVCQGYSLAQMEPAVQTERRKTLYTHADAIGHRGRKKKIKIRIGGNDVSWKGMLWLRSGGNPRCRDVMTRDVTCHAGA